MFKIEDKELIDITEINPIDYNLTLGLRKLARFDYEQQSPFMRLKQYASLINPIAGRGTSQYASGPSANPLLSGLTGAYMGSQMFPGSPFAMGLGALGGILG